VTTDLVFYDGDCGFCHRSVRFLLARDPDGSRFRYAPLQGETVGRLLGAAERASLPDSLVVRTAAGELLVRSRALLHVLRRLGGAWALLAGLLWLVPRPLRDATYDAFARVRYRLFVRPTEACPVLSPSLRARFEA
jgi:predicted DCC family thiol-disulfide oxidoreductase YuxK